MKKLCLILLSCILTLSLFAQDSTADKRLTKAEKKAAKKERINMLIKQEEEGELVFRKQSAFGFKLNSDGYGFSYEWGKFKSPRKTTLFMLEWNERKHQKEKKLAAFFNGFQFNSVVYGKANNFYQFKLGLGQQRIIGGKGNKNGVAVAAIYAAGLSAGLVKPYYVDVEDNNGLRVRKTYPTIIDSGYLELGASGFTVGWNQVKVRPGVHAKAALRFDYGRFNETVTAIEAGLVAEYYSSKVLQVVYNKEKQFFFNAYISLLLGKRK